MKIGVDLDDVTVDFINPFIDYYNKLNCRRVSLDNFFTYHFEYVLKRPKEEIGDIMKQFYQTPEFSTLPLLKGAKTGIYTLARNHELTFITSRLRISEDKTLENIRKRLPDLRFNGVIYTEEHDGIYKTKAEICREQGIDLMIEDSETQALKCCENNIKVVLFNRPWNKYFERPFMRRVENWTHALRAVNEFEKL